MPRCLRNILFWGAKVPLGSILGKEQENGMLYGRPFGEVLFIYKMWCAEIHIVRENICTVRGNVPALQYIY